MDRSTSSQRILIIDDDEGVRNFITRGLSRAGFTTVSADGGVSGIHQLSSSTFDAVVCDLNMPDRDGLEVLRFAASLSPRPVFLVLTGFGSINVAVEAMKRGAADFIEKPVTIDVLRAAIITALGKSEKEKAAPPKGLIGSPEWLDPFMAQLKRIALRDSTVLIEGETGTGKSAVAREIWRQSSRAKGPFVEMNCAAIPDNLMESELFGHKKGSFTGAQSDHVGRVEQASGGTLFLDEIGELKLDLQSKLLQVLQEKTFSPIGGKPLTVDVRFIAATNKNLENESVAGRFRSDLYYRLNVVGLTIPPLRERIADVPLLVDAFLKAHSAQLPGEEPPVFAPETLEAMMRYSWRGNVRELENFVEKMTVMHPSTTITPKLLLPRMKEEAGVSNSPTEPMTQVSTPSPRQPTMVAVPKGAENLPLSEQMQVLQKQQILHALEETGWNVSKAARQLGLKRTTLIEKMRKLGIQRGGGGSDGSPDGGSPEGVDEPSSES